MDVTDSDIHWLMYISQGLREENNDRPCQEEVNKNRDQCAGPPEREKGKREMYTRCPPCQALNLNIVFFFFFLKKKKKTIIIIIIITISSFHPKPIYGL